MRANIKIGRGKVRIEFSPAIAETLDRLLDGASGEILKALADEGKAIADGARARWPVGRERRSAKDGQGRPHSRDTIFDEVVVDPSAETVSLVVGVDAGQGNYVYKIKSGKNGLNGASPFQTLIRKPMREAADRLVRELGPRVASLATAGGSHGR